MNDRGGYRLTGGWVTQRHNDEHRHGEQQKELFTTQSYP